MKQEENKKEDREKQEGKKIGKIAGAECHDKTCPIHGPLSTRGRIFQGYVVKKFNRRIVIEFERTLYIRKYERYIKKKTKIHARLPKCLQDKIQIGDYIEIKECRPLSKIIHFVVIRKVR